MYYLLKEPYRFLQYQYMKAYILYNNIIPIDINHEALDILCLCNGENTKEDIVNILSQKYTDDNVYEFVSDFLNQIIVDGIATKESVKQKDNIEIIIEGTKEYWTPYHVILELTHKCPLLCKHCFIDAGKGADMKDNLVLNLVDELVDMKIKSVQLTGGEPLLHPQIVNIINRLIDGNINVNITTSGYYSNNSIIEAIERLKQNNGYIQVSLDGMMDYHNMVRGKKDAFDKAIEFIRIIVEKGVTVKVGTCFINQDIDELSQLCKFVKSLGVSEIKFGVVEDKGRAKNNEIGLNLDNYNIISHYIDVFRKKYQDETFYISKEEDHTDGHCSWLNCGCGYNMLKINPEGYVYDCVFANKDMGNIQDGTFVDYLKKNNDIIYKNVGRCAPNEGVCGECKELIRCKGCIVKGRESGCDKSYLFE